jgi:hypothetical protein
LTKAVEKSKIRRWIKDESVDETPLLLSIHDA